MAQGHLLKVLLINYLRPRARLIFHIIGAVAAHADDFLLLGSVLEELLGEDREVHAPVATGPKGIGQPVFCPLANLLSIKHVGLFVCTNRPKEN